MSAVKTEYHERRKSIMLSELDEVRKKSLAKSLRKRHDVEGRRSSTVSFSEWQLQQKNLMKENRKRQLDAQRHMRSYKGTAETHQWHHQQKALVAEERRHRNDAEKTMRTYKAHRNSVVFSDSVLFSRCQSDTPTKQSHTKQSERRDDVQCSRSSFTASMLTEWHLQQTKNTKKERRRRTETEQSLRNYIGKMDFFDETEKVVSEEKPRPVSDIKYTNTTTRKSMKLDAESIVGSLVQFFSGARDIAFGVMPGGDEPKIPDEIPTLVNPQGPPETESVGGERNFGGVNKFERLLEDESFCSELTGLTTEDESFDENLNAHIMPSMTDEELVSSFLNELNFTETNEVDSVQLDEKSIYTKSSLFDLF